MSKSYYSVELLINKVKEYPILYNKVSGSVNNDEKNQAWISIAREIHEKPDFLKKRWRNLRDSYQKAVKNKRDLMEMGQLSRYHPYRHEQTMSFLLPHILQEIDTRKRKSTKILSSEISKKEALQYTYSIEPSADQQDVEYLITEDCDERTDEEEYENNLTQEEEYTQDDLMDETTGSEQLETESNLLYEDEEVEQNITPATHQHRANNKDDDIEVWLAMIRREMLKLSNINRAKAKRDINTILSKYEIEQYESESINI